MSEQKGPENRGPQFPQAGKAKSRNVVRLTLKGAKSQVFRFDKERLVLGSVVSADVRVDRTGVAPIHAVVEVLRVQDGLIATLYDMASTAGTFVNREKVVVRTLKVGDVISIGGADIEYNIEDASAQSLKSSELEKLQGRRLFFKSDEDLSPLLLENMDESKSIFDYRPSDKPAVEVVMSWMENILDVQHFVKKSQVTAGTSVTDDFGIPSLLSSQKHVLLTRQGEGSATLHLDPKMKGVLQQKGELRRIEEIQDKTVQFERNDFAKIAVGDIEFYVSFTASPPKLIHRKPFDRDPFFFKILVTSALLSAVLLGTILTIPVPQDVEAEKVPEPVAQVLYKPELYTYQNIEKAKEQVLEERIEAKPPPPKPPEPVKPKPVQKVDLSQTKPIEKPKPKTDAPLDVTKKAQEAKPAPVKPAPQKEAKMSQGSAKEGAGARAKGEEGTRGTKKGPKSDNPSTAASRPGPKPGEGRGGGKSFQTDEGNVAFLKGASATIENMLGAAGDRLGKDGSKLKGFGAFSTEGKGGLALSGEGAGGGGTADSLGGLSDHGRGGGRVGTGLGAAGNGRGIIGGKGRVEIRTGGAEETVVQGSVDRDAILAALLAHEDEFRYCYSKELNQGGAPDLAGRINTSFVIGPTGRVTQTGIADSSVTNRNLEKCILKVIERIDFPKPAGGGVVQVKFPFRFKPTGGG